MKEYQFYLYNSLKRELLEKYRRSKLGAIWVIIGPLSQVLIYAIVLSSVLSSKLPGIDSRYAYSIYLIAGISAWTLFENIFNKSSTMFFDNSNIIKKVKIPKYVIQISIIINGLFNYFLVIASGTVVFIFLGHELTVGLLYIIPLTFAFAIFASSLGMIIGIFNIFFRDIGQIIPILLQITFWFTPIVYPKNIIPDYYVQYLQYNPLFKFIDTYHEIIVYHNAVELSQVAYLFSLSLIMFAFSSALMKVAEKDIMDVI